MSASLATVAPASRASARHGDGARAPIARPFRVPLIALLGACVVVGCATEIPLPPSDDSPLLHLLVRPIDARDTTAADSGMFAILLTAGHVLESPYRTAQRFEMVRTADGRRFAWRHTGLTGPGPAGYSGLNPTVGNYFLPRSGEGDLGWEDVQPGDELRLVVETDGVVLTGHTRVPGPIVASAERVSEETHLTWRAVPDAGGYVVASADRRLLGSVSALLQDTTLVLERAPGLSLVDTVAVIAVDSGTARFMSDETAPRGGIDAGFGLFGSYTRTVLAKPDT